MEKPVYQLIRSGRKTVAIQIKPDGTLIVRAPWKMDAAQIDRFVGSKRRWIEANLPQPSSLPKYTDDQLLALAQEAKAVIPARAAYFADIMGVRYSKITIRAQRSRWGSCSSKGNLNFNCLLMLTPGDVVDYVVVHELCHLKEMNHSHRFWAEVERILPHYRESRTWLKTQGRALIGRLRTTEKTEG